jgi:hypothetical protein
MAFDEAWTTLNVVYIGDLMGTVMEAYRRHEHRQLHLTHHP